MTENHMEKRRESRIELQQYHCVEVRTLKTFFIYQFKIWNISSEGMCLLVREDSAFLNNVNVGDILDVKYYPSDLSWPPDVHRTRIMHISKGEEEAFKAYYFVGLMIEK